MSERVAVEKVQELMQSLDQVKRYKALARLLVDFLIIVLLSIVALFFLQLAVNFYHLTTGFPSYFTYPSSQVMVVSSGGFSVLELVISLFHLIIPAVGVLAGILWVDRRLKKVKLNTWRSTIDEGFAGALKLLQGLDWDIVLADIRDSKIAYALYSVVRVFGLWVLAAAILFFPYGFGLSLLHVDVNYYFLAFISLIVALVPSKKDLQRRYQQITSLDALLWELRWFNSEFKSAEFQT